MTHQRKRLTSTALFAAILLITMVLPWEEPRWTSAPIGPGAGVARRNWTAWQWPFPCIGIAALLAVIGVWRNSRAGKRAAVSAALVAATLAGGAFGCLLTEERTRPGLGLTVALAASLELVLWTIGGASGARWLPVHVALALLASFVRPDDAPSFEGAGGGRRIGGTWVEYVLAPDRITMACAVAGEGHVRGVGSGRSDAGSWIELRVEGGGSGVVRWDSEVLCIGEQRFERSGADVCVVWLESSGLRGEHLPEAMHPLRRHWLRFLQHGVLDELERVVSSEEIAAAVARLRGS